MNKEIFYGLFSEAEIETLISNRKVIRLKGKEPVLIGTECLLKVNTNIGVSSLDDYEYEIKKIKTISSLTYRPDSVMDHTIVPLEKPLWRTMLEEFDGAIGTLPHYLPYDQNTGIRESDFFDNLLDMARGGVSFVTLHPTADIELYKEAYSSKRIIPTTSRGGYVLLNDQVINNRTENIVAHNFEKIMVILREFDMAVSIGSVFRPGTIHEALDHIHRKETLLQKKYIDIAKHFGVQVQMEGIGHMPFDKMNEYADFIRPFDAPLMPLGPMPSDEIIGFDHVTNAIGASMMAATGVVGMINSVTREEHTGRVPSFDSIIEGLKAAKVAAHCYNLSKYPKYKIATEVIGVARAQNMTCIQRGGIFDYQPDFSETEECSRCRRECPLKKIIF